MQQRNKSIFWRIRHVHILPLQLPMIMVSLGYGKEIQKLLEVAACQISFESQDSPRKPHCDRMDHPSHYSCRYDGLDSRLRLVL